MMLELLDMGKYGVFIWASYGASVLVIGGLMIRILQQRKKAKAVLRDIEHQMKSTSPS
jgi:heme exporter protein CcmD